MNKTNETLFAKYRRVKRMPYKRLSNAEKVMKFSMLLVKIALICFGLYLIFPLALFIAIQCSIGKIAYGTFAGAGYRPVTGSRYYGRY